MSRVRRWTDRETGMRHTHIELDPVRDAQLWAATDQHRRTVRAAGGRKTWDELQLDALLAAVTAGGEAVAELHVLVDLDTLHTGLHDKTVCELSDGTAVTVSTVRQMACDAEIIPVVLDGDGRALDVGRGARLATEAQRRRCGRCIAPASGRTAVCRSTTAAFTTSCRGNAEGPPTVRTWHPFASQASIIIKSTRAAGH